MADAPPPGGPRRLRAADLIRFIGALLASLGLGSLLDRLRKRSIMSESDPRPPQSDVEQERRANADRDAQIEAARAAGHEPSDVRFGRILGVGVAIAAIGLLTSAALYGLFAVFQARPPAAQPPSALTGAQPTPSGPRLQTDPLADWQDLRGTEEASLHSYGWADRGAGRVRIPIDRAIELLAERGLPVAPGPARPFGGDRTPNLDSSGGRAPTGTPAPQATPTASP